MIFVKPQQVRLVIADSHPIFRAGLRRLLEVEPDHKVIGEAADGAEAVRLARQLEPDILLMDLAMLQHSGLEALRELSTPANAAPVRVIVLTDAVRKDEIVEALRLGARGVVRKNSSSQILLRAIHTVMAGGRWAFLGDLNQRRLQARVVPVFEDLWGVRFEEMNPLHKISLIAAVTMLVLFVLGIVVNGIWR